MRLIDKDALMQDLEKWMKHVDPTHPQEDNAIPPLDDIVVSTLMTIEEQPTIEERKTGEWIVYKAPDKYHCGLCKCPFCGEGMIAEADEYKFCPNCGADMRGEQHEVN